MDIQRNEIKERAKKEPDTMPSKIVHESKMKLDNDEMMRAATDEADLQTIGRLIFLMNLKINFKCRVRRQNNKEVNARNHMNVNISHEYTLNKHGERFLLYDSKLDITNDYTANNQRIIIFASKEVFIENKNFNC